MSGPAGEPYPAAEPVLYPQLLRTPAYAPWRAVVGIVVLLVGVFALAGVVFLPVLAAALAVQCALEGTHFSVGLVQHAVTAGRATPAYLLYVNLALGSGTLLVWALVRWLHHLRPRWTTSVLPGIRWRFLLACLPIAVLALLVNLLMSVVLPSDADSTSGRGLNHLGGEAISYLLVIALTTPLQAMAEEYVFRGYLMQAVGSFFRRWSGLATGVAVVVPALLFALAHGAQNPPLFFDRFAFGVLAAYLVIRVGGLEAGLALHVVNNFFAFGAAVLYGDMATALTPGPSSYWQIPVTLVENLFYLLAVLWLARATGVRNRTLVTPAGGSVSIGGPSA